MAKRLVSESDENAMPAYNKLVTRTNAPDTYPMPKPAPSIPKKPMQVTTSDFSSQMGNADSTRQTAK